jgi:hypothetical protein
VIRDSGNACAHFKTGLRPYWERKKCSIVSVVPTVPHCSHYRLIVVINRKNVRIKQRSEMTESSENIRNMAGALRATGFVPYPITHARYLAHAHSLASPAARSCDTGAAAPRRHRVALAGPAGFPVKKFRDRTMRPSCATTSDAKR